MDIESAEEAFEFLAQNRNKLDTGGNFIYIMADEKTNVENFLSSQLGERYLNTVVLNIREGVNRRSIIDVYAKRYFSNNQRVEPYILGSFIDNRFIILDTLSRNMVSSSFP